MIEYDYEGHPEMSMEIEGLTGEIGVFMRGINTHYNYGKGVNYRVGAFIKKNKDPKKEVKKMLKLTLEKGSIVPQEIYIIASDPAHGLPVWKIISKFYKGRVDEPDVLLYGDHGPANDSKKFRTEGVWKATLPFLVKYSPFLDRLG